LSFATTSNSNEEEPFMFGHRLLWLWGLLAALTVADRQLEAAPPAPKVYAYCVEMGVPGLKPRPVAELARLLREVGFDGAGYAILTGPRLDETLRASDEAGLQIYLLQTAINIGPQATRRYDAQVPEAIRKLKGRPVTVVVTINGLKPGDPTGMEPAVQALRELGDVAAEAGVRISAYNHVSCWNESVPFNVELVKKVNHPQVGFNFNVCHWLKVDGNKDYRPLLRANADKLFCVTICGAQIGANTWTNGLIQPLDQGDFDNRAVLATLREIGYRGPVGVMCYGIPGDAREYLQRSLKTWKMWTGENAKTR
jgi:sugar phosphate isomerase/epimerase